MKRKVQKTFLLTLIIVAFICVWIFAITELFEGNVSFRGGLSLILNSAFCSAATIGILLMLFLPQEKPGQ